MENYESSVSQLNAPNANPYEGAVIQQTPFDEMPANGRAFNSFEDAVGAEEANHSGIHQADLNGFSTATNFDDFVFSHGATVNGETSGFDIDNLLNDDEEVAALLENGVNLEWLEYES